MLRHIWTSRPTSARCCLRDMATWHFKSGLQSQRWFTFLHQTKRLSMWQGCLRCAGCHAWMQPVSAAAVAKEDFDFLGWVSGAGERFSSAQASCPMKPGGSGMRMSSTLLTMRSIRWRLGSSWKTSFHQRWMQSWPEHHSFQAVPGGAWFSAPGGIGRLMGRDGGTRGTGRHHRSRRQDLTSGSEPRPHFEHGCSLQRRTLSSSCRTDAWDAAKHADAHVRVASRVPAWTVRIALGRPYAVETSPWGNPRGWTCQRWIYRRIKGGCCGIWWLGGLLCALAALDRKEGRPRLGPCLRGKTIRCAEEEDSPNPSSSAWSRPLLPTAADSSSASTNPVNVLEEVATKRVKAWRVANKMEDEADFAWAFPTYESAILAGGHCLAAAWVEARARQEEFLIPLAAQVLEAPTPRPSMAPSLQVRAKPKAWGKSKRQPLRLRENAQDKPDAIQRRVDALAQVLQCLGALHPGGAMTTQLQSEWHLSCRRLAQSLVTSAEAVTITSAVRTAAELNEFMESRGRRGTPTYVDLDAFIHAPSTTAPCRALNSLRWLNRHGQLSWELATLQAPTERSRRTEKKQAAVIVPPMWPFLEERVEALHAAGDERWTALLACWLVGAGCLRYRHIQRSGFRKITKSTAHCHCTKGKQSRLRSGFHFCVPSCFSNGFCWAKEVLQLWEKLPEASKARSGLCFDAAGNAWPIGEINTTAREIFTEAVDASEELSTYSFRRLPSTAAHVLGMGPLELASLGDWTNKSDVPQGGKMPIHYSGARYGQSMKTKHTILGAMTELSQSETWELLPQTTIDKGLQAGKEFAEKALQQDKTVLWARPLSIAEAREQFAITAALRRRVQKRKAEAMDVVERNSMPSAVAGKKVTAFMRNGVPLCAAFQQQSCLLSEQECSAAHRCAIVLRTGRACGGHHAAVSCYDKRAVLQETPSEPQSVKQPSPKPAMLQSKPKPKARPRQSASSQSDRLEASSWRGTPEVAITKESSAAEQQQAAPPKATEDEHFDRLAAPGKKLAQPPTKIYENAQGGSLWLTGLPRESNVHQFPANTTLQIVCFHQQVADKGGVVLPGALVCHICPASKRDREAQWRTLWPTVRNTIQAGETVVTHCVAGRHRAAGLGVLLRSILMSESIDQSASWINERRDIDLRSLFKDYTVRDWVYQTRRAYSMVGPLPSVEGFMATAKSNVHLMTCGEVPLCSHKQSQTKAPSRLVGPIKTQRMAEAKSWNQPLCQACFYRAPASLQKKLQSW